MRNKQSIQIDRTPGAGERNSVKPELRTRGEDGQMTVLVAVLIAFLILFISIMVSLQYFQFHFVQPLKTVCS